MPSIDINTHSHLILIIKIFMIRNKKKKLKRKKKKKSKEELLHVSPINDGFGMMMLFHFLIMSLILFFRGGSKFLVIS